MHFDLTYRNIRATDALKDRAERKFLKVSKHLREPIEAHVVLRLEKHRHMAEATISASGDVFKAQEESGDMYTTIDGLMNPLARTVRRPRARKLDRRQAGSGDATDGFSKLVDEGEELEA